MRDYFQFEIDLQFVSGRIILSNDGSRFYRSEKSGLYENFNSLKEVNMPGVENSNPFENLYSEIALNLSGKIDIITGSIEDNLQIMDIMEKIG